MRVQSIGGFRVLLAGAVLVGFVATSWAAGAPVAQVYLANGKAGLRAEGTAADRPLARGAVLSANDRITVEPGAEIGIYYRDGGRKIVRGGERGVSGSVASFAPAVEPYRGQAVSFGATRGGESDEVAADTFGCWPDEIPVVASMPLFTIALGGAPGDTAVIASATMRVLCGDSVVAVASIDFPAPGRALRLAVPVATSGEEYTLQVVLSPTAVDAEAFTHTARFYVAAPSASSGGLDDLLTPFFYCHGKVDVRFGATVRTMRFERELGDAVGIATLSTIVTPVFGP
jgi:hypothetical protein